MDRYDASGNIEAQFEPGSDGRVLRNKLGVRDSAEMDEIELDLLDQLHNSIPDLVREDQRIHADDIREWHRRWLGNVYAWAGKERSVNLGKAGFQFAAAKQVGYLMHEFDGGALAEHTPCLGMAGDKLGHAIAVVHIELILIHPFREGNGRIARLLASVMAMQAGYEELDFTTWDENRQDYFAAIHAGLDNYEPMEVMVRRVLSDSR